MPLLLTPTYHRDTYPSISPTKPSLNQAGKTILITGGASGGIGFEIARSFAKASASRVVIVGRRAESLDEAVVKLREEFPDRTEFIAHRTDIASDSSIASLWEFLYSKNILIHVLVLSAAEFYPMGPTLSMAKDELMKAFNTNVGGNFVMATNFMKQTLRPAGVQLFLINLSTAAVHTQLPMITSYTITKAAFASLIGHMANECPVEDVQMISFHPGAHYSKSSAKFMSKDYVEWDEFALPADFSVWAASPEASWLHGRFVWAHWDVDELKADPEILRRLGEEQGYLKVGVQGLTAATFEPKTENGPYVLDV